MSHCDFMLARSTSAASDAFARCQSIKVFRNVCLGEPTQEQLDRLKAAFQSEHNMKDVFAEAVVQCAGG